MDGLVVICAVIGIAGGICGLLAVRESRKAMRLFRRLHGMGN